MVLSDIGEKAIGEYLKCLSNSFDLAPPENGCYMLTPFIRPDGEAIGLEITLLPNEDIRVSDLGDTLGYLYVNGLTPDLTAPSYAHSIAAAFGAAFGDSGMTIDSRPADLGGSVHNLIQSILAVTSFAQGRASRVSSLSEVGRDPA